MEQTVIGTVEGITEKPSGWIEVAVSVPGKQYPVKLATKKSEIIDAVRALGVGTGSFSYNEVESEKINPNSGKPYVNRYLEGVEAGGATNAGVSLPEPHHAPVVGGDKDRAITRMACLKSAAELVAHHPTYAKVEDPGLEVIRQAHRFEQDVYRDINPVPFE